MSVQSNSQTESILFFTYKSFLITLNSKCTLVLSTYFIIYLKLELILKWCYENFTKIGTEMIWKIEQKNRTKYNHTKNHAESVSEIIPKNWNITRVNTPINDRLTNNNNNHNNNRIYKAPYGRNFRGAGSGSDQCSVKTWLNRKVLPVSLDLKRTESLQTAARELVRA